MSASIRRLLLAGFTVLAFASTVHAQGRGPVGDAASTGSAMTASSIRIRAVRSMCVAAAATCPIRAARISCAPPRRSRRPSRLQPPASTPTRPSRPVRAGHRPRRSFAPGGREGEGHPARARQRADRLRQDLWPDHRRRVPGAGVQLQENEPGLLAPGDRLSRALRAGDDHRRPAGPPTDPGGRQRPGRRYGVGVGKQGFSWSGTATVNSKQAWPDWYPPKEMIARSPKLASEVDKLQSGLGVSGGLRNPLGARAMYLWQGNRTRCSASTGLWSLSPSARACRRAASA